MLANGSMPIMATAAAPAEAPRLAAAGEILSLPDDRRNLAASSSFSNGSAANNNARTSSTSPKTDETYQDQECTGSLPPPAISMSTPASAYTAADTASGRSSPSSEKSRPAKRPSEKLGDPNSTSNSPRKVAAAGPSVAPIASPSRDGQRMSTLNEPPTSRKKEQSKKFGAPLPTAPALKEMDASAAASSSALAVTVDVAPASTEGSASATRAVEATPPPPTTNSKAPLAPIIPSTTSTSRAVKSAEPLIPAAAVKQKHHQVGASSTKGTSQNGRQQDKREGEPRTIGRIDRPEFKRDRTYAEKHIAAATTAGAGPVGMEVDEESAPRRATTTAAPLSFSTPPLLPPPPPQHPSINISAALEPEEGEGRMGGEGSEDEATTTKPAATVGMKVGRDENKKRKEREGGGGEFSFGSSGGEIGVRCAGAGVDAAASPGEEEEEEQQQSMCDKKRREMSFPGASLATAAAAAAITKKAGGGGEAEDASFSYPLSVTEDLPLGEGWDEHGGDSSKITNEAIRKAHCEAWIAKLRQEAAALRAGDHPVVLRRSVLTVKASKLRLNMSETNAKRQKENAERMYNLEVKSIQASYEVAMEQTRERLMIEINEEIRRAKSRMEGGKDVESRMNTRHTRGNAKGSIEEPWLSQPNPKSNGNSKRPLCPISLSLEEDALAEDIDFLRYVGNDSNNNHNNSGGGGGEGGAYGGAEYDTSPGVSGRARRPPAWRRED